MCNFAELKKLRAVPFHRTLVALFKVFQLLQLKEKRVIFFSQRKTEKKKAYPSRKVGRDVKFFIKNTTRGTRVEIFNKTRRA